MKQNKQKQGRPDKVSIAVALLFLVFAVGVVQTIVELSTLPDTVFSEPIIFLPFLSLVFTFFIICMIREGKNWARIVFLFFFIIQVPLAVLFLTSSILTNPFLGVIRICLMVLQIIALVFLFQKPSSDWFKLMKTK